MAKKKKEAMRAYGEFLRYGVDHYNKGFEEGKEFAERDAWHSAGWVFAVGIFVAIAVALLTNWIGFEAGKKDIRASAIKNGVGTYWIDKKTGEIEFFWRP